MKGLGTKKLRHCILEIHGIFDNNLVNGKGYKKWKRYTQNNGAKPARQSEFYVYRGMLRDSRIEGKGEFKWPDGRHYIGDF